MKSRVSKNEQKLRPSAKSASQTEPDGLVNKAVKRATKKRISRQARAESDTNETNVSRGEDQQPGNGSPQTTEPKEYSCGKQADLLSHAIGFCAVKIKIPINRSGSARRQSLFRTI
jgi:hypothetical protein